MNGKNSSGAVMTYVFLMGVVVGVGLPFLMGLHAEKHLVAKQAVSHEVCAGRLDQWLYGGKWVASDGVSAYQGLVRAMGDCMGGGDGK